MDETSRDSSSDVSAPDVPASGAPHATPERRPSPPAAAPADVATADVRASDADRDRFADILREALAQGRLDPEEHAERIDRVYRAKTLGELQPLISDLPEGRPAAPAPARPPAPPPGAPVAPGDRLTAVFSQASRKGRWRVGFRTSVLAVFGNVEIDLTEALFEHRQVEIHVNAVFGNVSIRVPENVTLRGAGSGVLGNYEVETAESPDGDAPVVVVSGLALLSSVEAKPKRGSLLKDLRSRRQKRPDLPGDTPR